MKKMMELIQVPLSVNFHFTRLCNFNCYFCFHTAREFELLPIDVAKRGLFELKRNGMEKLNLTGYSKVDLDLPCVSIVTNGYFTSEDFFSKYGDFVDIYGVSIDSFDPETIKKIGRKEVDVNLISDLCEKYVVDLKINTVVNRYNYNEDMSYEISELDPMRWKAFQVTCVPTENEDDTDIYSISKEQFDSFVETNRTNLGPEKSGILIPETSEVVSDSYLILDEEMRFLNCKTKEPGEPIFEAGVIEALEKTDFNWDNFIGRGGYFWKDQESQNY